VTVTRFGPGSVILDRTDYGPYPGRAHLTGQISSEGNGLASGTITWTYHPGLGLGSFPFAITWCAALEDLPGSGDPPWATGTQGSQQLANPDLTLEDFHKYLQILDDALRSGGDAMHIWKEYKNNQ
jgi:hypothetical protein